MALDKNNVPIAPDPNVPTPTADRAHLRLILHVNGAGQVSLLRDVAVLNRRPEPAPGASTGPVTGAAVEIVSPRPAEFQAAIVGLQMQRRA